MNNGIYKPFLKQWAFMEICYVPSPEFGIAEKKEEGAGPESKASHCGISIQPCPPLPVQAPQF